MLTRKLKAVNGPATSHLRHGEVAGAGLHQPDPEEHQGLGRRHPELDHEPAGVGQPSGFTEPSATTRKASLGTAPANAPAYSSPSSVSKVRRTIEWNCSSWGSKT